MFYSARESVTEIGEKEKMKSKLLATLVVLVLLCGTFAMAIQFSPKAKADYTLYHLNVYADPSVVPPSAGTGDYTPGTLVQLNFTDPVIIDDAKYVFSYWDIDNGTWTGSSNPLQYVTMNADHNVTAHYNTQYKFTVSYPWNALWMESFTPWIWQETGPGTGFVAGNGANGTYWAWIPKNEKVQAGISSPEWGMYGPDYAPFGVPWIRGRHLEEVVIFTNWTNLGYYMSGQYAWSKACQINMTCPKSATMAMKMNYWLWVKSDQAPTPSGQGWYDKDTPVTLTANKIPVNWAREWRIDHWEVDGVSRGQYVNPIIVNMNTNHTASAFYNCWVFIYLDDDIVNASGIRDTGKWYLEGVPQTFTAPSPVPIDSKREWQFGYWEKYPGGAWTNSSNPLHLILDATWAGYTLRARYYLYFNVTVVSSGSSAVPGFLYPDSDVSGWYRQGAPINVKAYPIVDVPSSGGKTHWKFDRWTYDMVDPWSTNNNASGVIWDSWVFTAHYVLEQYRTWRAIGSKGETISVTGFPGHDWQKNGTTLWWGAPSTDDSHIFQFYYWDIPGTPGTPYAQGKTWVDTLVTGPMDGVAYYANMTNFYLTPAVVSRNAHTEGYCTKFNVTVTAANFDAKRVNSLYSPGQSMAIYAMDFKVNFNPKLMEVQKVFLNLDQFWGGTQNVTYFVAKSVYDNTAGYYWLSATVQGNHTGFEGTRPVVTIEFHVIYSPTAAEGKITDAITIGPITLLNNNGTYGTQIYPELASGTWYYITPPQPVLEIKDAYDLDNQVIVHTWPITFDVQVWLKYGIKVKDYTVYVTYDNTQIEVVTVTMGTYLKEPYKRNGWSKGVGAPLPGGIAWVKVEQEEECTVPPQNCSGILFTITFKVVHGFFWTFSQHDLHSMISIDLDSGLSYISVVGGAPGSPTPKNIAKPELGSKDCQFLYNQIIGDLDFDGEVTVLDLQLVADNYCTGKYDLNCDTHTNIFDLVIVALNFGKEAPPRG
jgi:hypothetical protein